MVVAVEDPAPSLPAVRWCKGSDFLLRIKAPNLSWPIEHLSVVLHRHTY
jgi:hypothetical protein